MTVKRSAALLLLSTLLVLPPCFTQAKPPSAAKILASVRAASGGDAWDQFSECDSEGSISVAGKAGTLHYLEDLGTGANVSRISIPDLGLKQANGTAPGRSWQQDAAGDIQLLHSGDP